MGQPGSFWLPMHFRAIVCISSLLGLSLLSGCSKPPAPVSVTDSQGTAEKIFLEGRSYLRGEGVPQDDSKARQLFLQAAELGNGKAQNNLGMMCMEGRGGPKDPEACLKWLTAASEQGLGMSQQVLGSILLTSQTVPTNTAEGLKWLKAAGDAGMVEAQLLLAKSYFLGANGVAADQLAAVKWIELAAANGKPWAQNAYGTLYLKGIGVQKDTAKAAEWYLKAAEAGEGKAQANLAHLYASGDGVAKDPVAAYFWMRLSSEQGTAVGYDTLAAFQLELSPEQLEKANSDLRAYRQKNGLPEKTPESM